MFPPKVNYKNDGILTNDKNRVQGLGFGVRGFGF